MDTSTAYTTVSLVMLANGAVLSVVYQDLPPALRPAAKHWQIGTLLIALGCAIFAFGGPLPRPVMLTAANGLFVFGLTAYLWSLEIFHGARARAWHLLPGFAATACVFWFSAIEGNFQIRLVVVSVAWAWLMLLCAQQLIDTPHRDSSLSRKVLAGIFIVAIAFIAIRLAVYLHLGPAPEFMIEASGNWMNLVSPLFLTLLPITGTTVFVLMCSDHLKQQLARAASTDYLTGLPNRRSLAEGGKKLFRRARKEHTGFVVAVLDLDAFKTINDTYGHDVGDKVLVHVAGHLRAAARETDLVARSGGEEFVVLFDGLDEAEATAAVEHIRRAVEREVVSSGAARIGVTLSAGIATARTGDSGFDAVLLRADKALYGAKSSGRNRVERAA